MNQPSAAPPPLPPPSGDVCPNCRAPVDIRAEFCAHCGAKLLRSPRDANRTFWSDLGHGLVSLGLLFLTLFLGLGGSCAALILVSGGGGDVGSLLGIGALAAIGFGGAWLCWKTYSKRGRNRL